MNTAHFNLQDLLSPVSGALLYNASKLGYSKKVKGLLKSERNIDIDFTDDHGFTPVYVASQQGHSEVVIVLVRAGANVHLACEDGSTPLAAAACENRHEICKILLNAGANINCTRNDGKSPLYIASWQGHIPTLQTLIAHGADVDLASKGGVTPIAISAFYGQEEVVRLLVKSHAKILDKNGQCPAIHMAGISQQKEITKKIMKYMPVTQQKKIIKYLKCETMWLHLRPLFLMRPHEDHATNPAHNMKMLGFLVTAKESDDVELFDLKRLVASFLH